MGKANKDGWIRHRGGKCPVERGVLVDVRYRDGSTTAGVSALTGCGDSEHVAGESSGPVRIAYDWDHDDSRGDIMAYRPHNPEHQVVAPDNPIHWRDRIREIDETVKALTGERAELIRCLADEGFSLVDAGPKPEPEEDMTDWRNWKVGDLLEVVDAQKGHQFNIGEIVRIINADDGYSDIPIGCEHLDGRDFFWVCAPEVKWHSRPVDGFLIPD